MFLEKDVCAEILGKNYAVYTRMITYMGFLLETWHVNILCIWHVGTLFT